MKILIFFFRNFFDFSQIILKIHLNFQEQKGIFQPGISIRNVKNLFKKKHFLPEHPSSYFLPISYFFMNGVLSEVK